MFVTFPVIGNGTATINTRIFISNERLIPNCQECGQTMNEIYIIDGCVYLPDEIHLHFSHKHYESNREYRSHYCLQGKKFYDSAK